jgi:hypothetical protein
MLQEDETIPASLEAGFEQLGHLDRHWVWVLESGGEIKGVLLASPCHGAAFIWRVAVAQGVEGWSVGKLLRRFLKDCKERGLRGYLTIVNPSVEAQGQLKSIVERAGGKAVGSYELLAGPTPKEFI